MPHAIAEDIYPGRLYSDLTPDEKLEVRAAQRLQLRWRNEDDLGKVYSTSCEKIFQARTRDPSTPCSKCHALLRNKAFIQANTRPPPDNKNLKFVEG